MDAKYLTVVLLQVLARGVLAETGLETLDSINAGGDEPTMADAYLEFITNGGQFAGEESGGGCGGYASEDDMDSGAGAGTCGGGASDGAGMDDFGGGQGTCGGGSDTGLNAYGGEGDTIEGPPLSAIIREFYDKFKGKTEADAVKILMNHFPEMDGNSDDRVSLSELTDWIKWTAEQEALNIQPDQLGFRKTDTNGDGMISHEESYTDYLKEMNGVSTDADREKRSESLRFTYADYNQDGYLNGTEFIHYMMPHAFYDTENYLIKEFINDYDSDLDGRISEAEYMQSTPESDKEATLMEKDRFSNFDTDGNGYLTVDEVQSITVESSSLGTVLEEANRIMKSCDDDKNRFLSRSEMEKNYKLFTDDKLDIYGESGSDLEEISTGSSSLRDEL